MSAESDMPEWVQNLFEALAATIEFEGMAYLEGQYSSPDKTEWETDLLEIAPALMKSTVATPDLKEPVYGLIHDFDLLAAQDAFEDVTALRFGVEDDGGSLVTIEGVASGREIIVRVRTVPFSEAKGDH